MTMTTATDTVAPNQRKDTGSVAVTKVTTDEDEKIQKAIKFWKHPSLHNVSSEEKRAYLHGQGLSNTQIHKAWEKMINEEDGGASEPVPQSNNAAPSPTPLPADPRVAPSPSHSFHNQPRSQQQHLYPQQPQQPYYPYPMEDEDGSISVAKGVSLVAVGGFLGLTAAAAFRWLNGGDFQLLPPPMDGSSMAALWHSQREAEKDEGRQREIMDGEYYDGVQYVEDEEDVQGNDKDYAYNEDEEYVDTLEVQQRLFEKMEALSEAVATNTSTQEKLMNKISNSTASITNQSMNLLRSSQTTKKGDDLDVSLLARQLNEVKQELSEFTETVVGTANGNRQELQDASAKLSEKLQKCLDMLKDSTEEPTIDTSLPASASDRAHGSSLSFPTETPLKSKYSSSFSSTSLLHDCIRQIAEGNDTPTLKVGTQLLYLYLVNLSGKPELGRYRKIYTSNQSFQKVESLVGGKELLQVVGFVADNDKSVLEWVPSGSSEEEIAALVLVKEAASALSILKSGKPGLELTELAISKLTPLEEARIDSIDEEGMIMASCRPTESSLRSSAHAMEEAPQTPAGSMLVSPPMTKKLPFPDQASATPTNLSDRLESLPMNDEEDDQ